MTISTDRDAKDWRTMSEAAEYVGLSVSTLIRYEKAGALHADRTLGGHRRFRLEHLDELKAKLHGDAA